MASCLILFFFMSLVPNVAAQSQCGVVESIGDPVDRATFSIMQDFGVPNFRFRGMFHTGEDYAAGRGATLGQPVRAIAAGRVTFSSPLAWGRDGGVVIIEHTFPDGSIFYSQYGHMVEAEGAAFPRAFTCVAQGDIIGVIGEARPSPHLHFEIRIDNFDVAGPGYTEPDPFDEGYRRPSKMLTNWRLWLSPLYRWHVDLIDEAGPASPPVVMSDNSLIYLDSSRIERATPDGRVLWRTNLERAAVALIDATDSAIIVYADGRMQPINGEGALGTGWETGIALASAPFYVGTQRVFRAADAGLVAFESDLLTVAWRIADVPPVTRWASSGGVLALVTTTDELLVAANGALLDRRQLAGAGSVTPTLDGALLVYAAGGMFRIDAPYTPDGQGGRTGGSALAFAADGGIVVLDGGVLTAFAPDMTTRYQYAVPGVSGAFDLSIYGDILVFISTHGYLGAVRVSDGALCGQARAFGDDRARVWSALGGDGILRVGIADQYAGIDWRGLLGACG
jgi:murein DD-endopeptidase MepM/ murein hydrolase activator NlpD